MPGIPYVTIFLVLSIEQYRLWGRRVLDRVQIIHIRMSVFQLSLPRYLDETVGGPQGQRKFHQAWPVKGPDALGERIL